MKKLYLLTIFTLCLFSLKAQTNEKFSYKISNSGNILITPNFDQSKSEGKRATIAFTDGAYFANKIYNEIRKVFSNDELTKIHKGSFYMIRISSTGDVLKCNFGINPDDKTIFTEDKLYQLYLNFKKMKFDMSKTRILGTIDTTFDYTDISGRILPRDQGR